MNYKSVCELCADHPNLAEYIMDRDRRIEQLSKALKDCISTYGDKEEIIVTQERQEAWKDALLRFGTPEMAQALNLSTK